MDTDPDQMDVCTEPTSLSPDQPVSHEADPLNALKDEVLKAIGRNVLTFQQIEGFLKYLVANSNIAAPHSEFRNIQNARAEKASGMTLGQLVGDMLKGPYCPDDRETAPPENLTEPWFAFSFRLNVSQDEYDERDAALTALVRQRNDLIHAFLPQWDPASLASTTSILASLKNLHENALRERDHLSAIAKALVAGRQDLAKTLASKEYREHLELARLQASPTIAMLLDMARQASRKGLDVPLDHAARRLQCSAETGEDFAERSKRYGYRSLKAMLVASGLFEVIDRPTPKGGVRVFIRERSAPSSVMTISADRED